jgi:hypothetical protein
MVALHQAVNKARRRWTVPEGNHAIATRFPENQRGLIARHWRCVAAGQARAADSLLGPPELPQGMLASSLLDALPGKVPLIKKTWRPPNFETPLSYFENTFTPNEAFFVRYHLSNIPEVAAATWSLKVGGEAAATPFELSLAELKRDYEQVRDRRGLPSLGNRRGMFRRMSRASNGNGRDG